MTTGHDYSHTVQRIIIGIQQLNQNVQTLNQYLGMSDDDEPRNAMKDLVQKSNALSKNINLMIKELVMSSSEDRQFRIQRERLTNDYMSVLNRLQAIQRKAVAKEKAQIKTVTIDDESLSSEAKGYGGVGDNSFRLKHIQQQHKVNLDEIKERQQALSELERDIGDINQIFKDLAHIVHDQGEMVDSIEANIEHTSIHVDQAHTSINQAYTYQKQARQKKIILSLFCIALLVIILFVFYLWSR